MDGLQLNIMLTLIFLAGLAIGAAAMWVWMGRKLAATRGGNEEERYWANQGADLCEEVEQVVSYLEGKKQGSCIKAHRLLTDALSDYSDEPLF